MASQATDVALTKKQVENSPGINTHKPSAAILKAEYFEYYAPALALNGLNKRAKIGNPHSTARIYALGATAQGAGFPL